MTPITSALERLDHIATCMEAVADLLIPEPDLHVVGRDKQAMLWAFLIEEHRIARDQLTEEIKQ